MISGVLTLEGRGTGIPVPHTNNDSFMGSRKYNCTDIKLLYDALLRLSMDIIAQRCTYISIT